MKNAPKRAKAEAGWVPVSRRTAAVRPTADAPWPVVYTARKAVFSMYLKTNTYVYQSISIENQHVCVSINQH